MDLPSTFFSPPSRRLPTASVVTVALLLFAVRMVSMQAVEAQDRRAGVVSDEVCMWDDGFARPAETLPRRTAGSGEQNGVWVDQLPHNNVPDGVHAMAWYDDGSGPKLVVGGDFDRVGSQEVAYIAQWDGTAWSSLGSGTDGPVLALQVFDEGNGPVLAAGGLFLQAGGVDVNTVARWDGTQWSDMDGGFTEYPAVYALTVFDDGSGPKLVAGGQLTGFGDGIPGVGAGHLAQWDGSSWNTLAQGLDNVVYALTPFQSPDGPRLIAGGLFRFRPFSSRLMNRVAQWDGTSWTPMGAGMDGAVIALTAYDPGGGEVVVAAGQFAEADGLPAARIAQWDGTAWTALSTETNGSIQTLAVDRSGDAPKLLAGGAFRFVESGATHLASWDGTFWTQVESGVQHSGGAPEVQAILQRTAGGETDLWVGGFFDQVGGSTASSHIGLLSCVRPEIFSDGFETGGLTAWSAVDPVLNP